MFATVVFVLVAGWVLAHLAWIRYTLRRGQPVLIPALANKLVLLIGLVVVVLLDLSPLHLLWWFPLSYLLGALILFMPSGVQFTMACLALLAWPSRTLKS